MRLTDTQLRAERAGLPIPPPKRRKRSSPEWQAQFALFKWWKNYSREAGIASCLLFSIPNGATFGVGNAAWQKEDRARKGRMMKLTGLTAGVADCFLAVPKSWRPHATECTRAGDTHGLFLELKAPNGIVSDDQQIFRAAVVAQGYQHVIAYGAEAAIEAVKKYLT